MINNDFLADIWSSCLFVSVFCTALLSPVCDAAHEFTAFRMIQYDMQGVSYGSASSVVSYDLRTLRSPYQQNLRDVGAGCLLIILPANWPNVGPADREDVLEVEDVLMADRWPMPVYFTTDSPKLHEIYLHAETVSAGKGQVATGAMGAMSQWFGDGYHLITPFKVEKQLQNYVVANVKASLSGLGAEDSLPTIVVVAHYDVGGSAPMRNQEHNFMFILMPLVGVKTADGSRIAAAANHLGYALSLSFGYDSNGSGVAALLELARILSRFYSTSKTHPKYNIQFLLTGAGKYNYMGSKFWIDALPETWHASSGVGQSGVQFVLCLDTLSSLSQGSQLHGHVSKPPKDDSPLDIFFKHLEQAVANVNKTEKSELLDPKLVHKKINLAATRLVWEHERFSIRRLPAMTLSVLQTGNTRHHDSITDFPPIDGSADSDIALCNNIWAIGEALTRYIYNIPIAQPNETNLANDISLLGSPSVQPSCDHVRSLRQWLSQVQRSAPLMPVAISSPRSQSVNPSSFLGTIQSYLAVWLPNAQITTHSLDKKEPELVFYENLEVKLSAFVVKPAIYDLFVACAVAAYLGLFYLSVLKFPYARIARMFLPSSQRILNQSRLKGQ